MNSIHCLALSAIAATLAIAHATSPSASSDAALMTELARADGRTLDANGNLIPSPLTRNTHAQKTGTSTVSVPAGMRFVPADASTGTSDFFAGIYEVTQAEYSAFLAANDAMSAPREWANRTCPPGWENFPVTGIARSDALAYCAWITEQTGRAVTLPTAAQAAAYSRGINTPAAADLNAPLHAVGADSRDVSAVGCFDVRANAAEWSLDQVDGQADARTGFRLVAPLEASTATERTISAFETGAGAAPTTPPTPNAPSPPPTNHIEIRSHPASQAVSLGGSVTLNVGASMVLANDGRTNTDMFDLSFQWIKDNTPIAGATSASYSIPTMREADAGAYYVKITNPATGIFVHSDPAVIDVGLSGSAPRITRSIPELAVANGGTATVSFDFATTHRYALAWMMQESSLTGLPSVPDVQITDSSTSSTATWRNAPRDGGLTFIFRVITAYGTTEASTKVNVINDGAAPAITRHPSAVAVTRGGSATLEAAATGTPTPSYQWLRNGTAIAGATASTLTISSVQDTDAGSYSVVATNALGSTISNTASLTISAVTAASSGGSGGGGAPSAWFFAGVAVLAALRVRALLRRTS